MSIELLQEISSAAGETVDGELPEEIVRFVLEHETGPDLAVERERVAALLGSGRFGLAPLDSDMPEFVVLQFPGVLREGLSPSGLYRAADALVEELGLVSAAPDLPATLATLPEDPSAPENVGELILNATCWVRPDPSLPFDWVLRTIRADRAWALSTGEGAVVAQPDTGVADHRELVDVLDLGRARNTLDGTDDATDPLDPSMRSPGHGTATSSVVASRVGGQVTGAAPAATVVPIRCLNSVVIGVQPAPLAKAILHAVRIKADVISMSLGGAFFSRSVSRALALAAASGAIVVSAGGNCVQPVVVYPARDRNAIALGGTSVEDRPWRGSSRGRKIDLSAPAENVFVARCSVDTPDQTVEPSQGTSFATALTAGAAALWVSHHGRQAVRDAADGRGISVNNLFRRALVVTARAAGLPRGFGAGVLDAEALLNLPLSEIPTGGTAERFGSADAREDAMSVAIDDTLTAAEIGDGDWARVGTEAAYVVADAWLRSRYSGAIALESALRPRPSPGLAARMPAVVAAALTAGQDGPDFVPPIRRPADSRHYLRHLAAGSARGPESSTVLTEAAALERICGPGRARLQAELLARLDALGSMPGTRAEAVGAVVQNAPGVLDKVAGRQLHNLDFEERVTLEALVRLRDRPAYRLTDEGDIDSNDPLYGEWGGFLDMIVDLPPWTKSVGRIDLDGVHVGTGFVAGPGRIMTNRHVLESIADEIGGPAGTQWSFGRGIVTIDFSPRSDGHTIHRIDRVAFAPSQRIGHFEQLARLDLAILGVSNGGPGLPAPLNLMLEGGLGSDLVTIGYPARPGTSALVDPSSGEVSREIAERLREIFATAYGEKYISPGRVMSKPGELSGDTNGWSASHDCTTLGGNSGSPIVAFTADPGVAMLHFSGAPLSANKAHVLVKVRDKVPGLPDLEWADNT